ncbi:MAG TPA: ABC transporter ATP-binding protein [Vitreimonas sp.]|nr:ABC transporter ATP-binding protein [Vitreimonas sp.]
MVIQNSLLKSKLALFSQTLFKHKKLMAGILVIEICLSIISVVIPYFTKIQVDYLQSQQASLPWLSGFSPLQIFAVLLLIPLSIELIRIVIFEKIRRQLSYVFGTELRLSTEQMIWQKLETLDAGFFANERNQRILASAINSTTVVRDFFEFIKQRVGNITTLLAILPLLGLISWELLVLVSVVAMLQVLLGEVARQQEVAMNTLRDQHNEQFWKVDRALTYDYYTLKTLGAVPKLLGMYNQLLRDRNALDLKHEAARDVLTLYDWILRNGLTLMTNVWVGWQVLEGSISLGTFTLVVSYTLQINGLLNSFLESAKGWRDIDLQWDRLHFLELLQPRISQAKRPQPLPSSPLELSFDKVAFTYPNLHDEEKKYIELMVTKTQGYLSKFASYYYKYDFEQWQKLLEAPVKTQQVLKNVTLKLERGKVIALLGRNGAGKTTLTQLLMHNYEPDKGKVLLDGQPLSNFLQNELLQLFAVIHQRPFILYRFTIRDNVLLGVNRQVNDDEIWQILKKLDLDIFIKHLPKQLDTLLGEGLNLSGGQEQLLAIARVFLQCRPFIIFDEGMNQLDVEHETKVLELLIEQSQQAGVLFITHRITVARKADYIYILDDGSIVEQGTHPSLLQKEGLYAKFWKLHVVE